jgi:diguanylate cyclase (GGDEF)-like protein/PAS domain S-box-containing protein
MKKATATLADDETAVLSRAGAPLAIGEARRRASRALIAGAVLVCVMVFSLTAIFISDWRRGVAEETEGQMRGLSLVLADRIASSIQALESIETSIAGEIQRGPALSPATFRKLFSSDAQHRELVARVSALPHIASLSLWDTQGDIVNSSFGWPRSRARLDPNPADRFLADGAVETIADEPSRTHITGKWSLRIIRKVVDPHGTFVGMIIGTIYLEEFEDYFERVKPSSNASIAMFSGTGVLMARYPRHPEMVGMRFTEQQLGDGIFSRTFSSLRIASPVDGNEKFVVVRKLPSYGALLVLTTSVEEALAGWRRAAIWVILSSGAVVAVIFAIVWATRRKITGTLRAHNLHLTSAMENMVDGLAMFDGAGRLIICNAQYGKMYGLSERVMMQGTPLRTILEYRRDNGTLRGDPEIYENELKEQLKNGERAAFVRTTEDGRLISMSNRPIEGGGWIATHRDISEASAKEKSFQLLFESNPVPMWVIDRATTAFLDINESAIAKYGYSRAEFLGMTLADVRPIEDIDRLKPLMSNSAKADSEANLRRHRKSDGSLIDVVIYSRELRYAGVSAQLVAIHDVTASKKSEDELRRTRKFLNTIIENVPLPIIVKSMPRGASDASACQMEVINKAAADMFELPAPQWIGKTLRELFPPEIAEPTIVMDNEALKSDSPVVSADRSVQTKSSRLRRVNSRRVVIRGEDGVPEHLIALLEDVTEQREAEQRISRMAHFDPLTNLANRASFDACFAATIARASEAESEVAVICMDLDGFKEVNDTFGHSAGDEVLRQVAARLSAVSEGAFLSRFGGDEFTLLVAEEGNFATSREISRQLLAAMHDDLMIDGHRVAVRLTLGIAVYPQHGHDGETVIANADRALYRAKASNPGTALFFDADMDAQIRERRAMQDDLRGAVDAGALALHYQPQVDIKGRPIGFEALLRWECPKRGFVPAATFIALAEESSLILQLGEWVLRAACREAAKWTQPMTVAVNLSPRQFRQADLPELIHGILLETGLPPARLELEITEGVLIEDYSRALSILRRIKSLGVAIALDDFGTGYSSLSYLHAFSFDRIKIDRGFVCDLATNRHSMAIVKAVISLARSLGVPVLAEGVETDEQRDILDAEGCDAIQGYLFGRPRPIEHYVAITHGVAGEGNELVA